MNHKLYHVQKLRPNHLKCLRLKLCFYEDPQTPYPVSGMTWTNITFMLHYKNSNVSPLCDRTLIVKEVQKLTYKVRMAPTSQLL